MAMVLTALARALPQIWLPGIRSVLWRTLGLTVLLFALLGILAWLGLRLAFTQTGWLDGGGLAGAALAGIIAVLASWILFRAVAIAIAGFYADRIVSTVEAVSYPGRAGLARSVPTATGIGIAIRSALRAIGWNLAALPVYVLLVATGVGAPLLFLTINAYLLGRDLGELIEGRYPDLPAFTSGQRWQIGLLSALLFLPPVVNLFAPIWSVVIATHMFHKRTLG